MHFCSFSQGSKRSHIKNRTPCPMFSKGRFLKEATRVTHVRASPVVSVAVNILQRVRGYRALEMIRTATENNTAAPRDDRVYQN